MNIQESNRIEEDLSLKLFIVMSRAFQSIKKRVEEDIKCYELNLTEFAVLELLYSKGDQPIQKIGDKVLIASSSITYVVDKLEKKKLIERKGCLKDRRITHATITSEGTEFMNEIFPKHKRAIQEICDSLDTQEKSNMIDQLKKLGYHAYAM
ncbi:MarR family transcriptional regulator [Alkalihalophilus pseudofirmus]|nr:MarR family transcriptional regulator [Alkalihalophilus pseudofirmus]